MGFSIIDKIFLNKIKNKLRKQIGFFKFMQNVIIIIIIISSPPL